MELKCHVSKIEIDADGSGSALLVLSENGGPITRVYLALTYKDKPPYQLKDKVTITIQSEGE